MKWQGQGCNAGFEHVHADVREVYVAMFALGKVMLGIQVKDGLAASGTQQIDGV